MHGTQIVFKQIYVCHHKYGKNVGDCQMHWKIAIATGVVWTLNYLHWQVNDCL